MANLELDDIQGIIISGYGHLPDSAYLFLHIDDQARARTWLAWLAGQITSADWGSPDGRQKPQVAVNVAFSAAGLRALGLKDTAMDTFAHEFIEGMAHPPRPRRMGDIGSSGPKHWEFGGERPPTSDEIDGLLILQASGRDALDRLCADHEGQLLARGIREVVTPRHHGCQDPIAPEHFGYRDAISQPEIEGSPNRRQTNQACVKAGEFVLGYVNEYDVLPQGPTVEAADDPSNLLKPYEQDAAEAPAKDLGRNGTYLVFRKISQDVAAFRRFLRDNSPNGTDKEMDFLAAKLMGRWPGGAPLAIADTDDPDLAEANDFGYATEDPYGLRCPMSAHIRRTNPRDHLVGSPAESRKVVNRHRIIRRAGLYGDRLPAGVFDDDGKPRGLLFICINADIERQFEFIQQTWANSPKFGGLYSDSDPIIGVNADPNPDPGEPTDPGPWTMTIPGATVRRQISNVPRFVTIRGGGYFFLPSIVAMRYLASLR